MMQFHYTPYILPLLACVLIAGAVAIYAWRHRSMSSAMVLSLLALAIMEWTLGYALEIAGANLETKIFWGKVQYIGIVTVPLLWLIFAIYYTNRGTWLSRRNLFLLSIIPFITVTLVFTNEAHGLIWSGIQIYEAENFSVLDVSYGLWFWLHFIYSYLLLAVGTLLILQSVGRRQGLYRGQAIALIIAVVAPWVGNVLYFLRFNFLALPPRLDLTPFAFTISVVALTWGIFRYRLIDLSPVARDLVVEEMNDGMIVLDAQSYVVDINPAAQRMMSCPAPQAIGQPIAGILQPWPQLIERFRDVPEAETEIAIGEGGDRRWYEIRLSPLHDQRQRFIGRVITVQNITERKRAEEQIRQLSRAVEASPTSIVITDTQGCIQYVNSKFTEVTGYTLAEAVGQNPRILKTDRTPPEVHRQLWETLLARREWHGEFCNRKKNGEFYWELASISPIIDAAGNVAFYVAIKEDITALKQMQEELVRAREQALEASRYKSELIAKVSHELRTPLSAILGYAEFLYKETFAPLTPQQKHFTAEILDSVKYLNSLINDLLDISQIERGTVKIQIAPFEVRKMIEQVNGALSPLAKARGLRFTIEVAPDLPDNLDGDQRRVRQILTNLVNNAIKFTEKGSIAVQIKLADQQHWVMQVRDTGPGISPEAQARIFESFWQADGSLTSQQRGYGLGLSIVKQLTELMGGEVMMDSTLGQGSTFRVRLPLEAPAGDAISLSQSRIESSI